jgi:hypothetical protein
MSHAAKPYEEEIARLRLFNEKAQALSRSRFASQVFQAKHGFTWITPGDGPMRTEWRGADEDATNALALNLRFFLQSHDKISLRQIEEMYEKLPVPDADKQIVRDARQFLNDVLDSPSLFVIKGETQNWRELLDVFLNGGLAHADHVGAYRRWMSADGGAMIRYQFEKATKVIIYVVCQLRFVNERTIAALESAAC